MQISPQLGPRFPDLATRARLSSFSRTVRVRLLVPEPFSLLLGTIQYPSPQWICQTKDAHEYSQGPYKNERPKGKRWKKKDDNNIWMYYFHSWIVRLLPTCIWGYLYQSGPRAPQLRFDSSV